MTVVRSCGNCVYAGEEFNYKQVLCQRHAPVTFGKFEHGSCRENKPVWPTMRADLDRCGDFLPVRIG